MKLFWTVVSALMAVGGFAWALYSVGGHFTRLEGRIETLENRVRLIVTAPAIVKPSEPSAAGPSDVRPMQMENPLISTCVDLIKRAAALREKGDINNALSLEGYLREYACSDALKSTKR